MASTHTPSRQQHQLQAPRSQARQQPPAHHATTATTHHARKHSQRPQTSLTKLVLLGVCCRTTMGAAAISDAPLMNALGFTGGGLLAVCLIPQIIKLLVTRSARDISLSWTLLYLAGTALTLAYLILQGAIAAWIPLVVETVACLLTLVLKLLFDHTSLGANPQVIRALEAIDASVHRHPSVTAGPPLQPAGVLTPRASLEGSIRCGGSVHLSQRSISVVSGSPTDHAAVAAHPHHHPQQQLQQRHRSATQQQQQEGGGGHGMGLPLLAVEQHPRLHPVGQQQVQQQQAQQQQAQQQQQHHDHQLQQGGTPLQLTALQQASLAAVRSMAPAP